MFVSIINLAFISGISLLLEDKKCEELTKFHMAWDVIFFVMLIPEALGAIILIVIARQVAVSLSHRVWSFNLICQLSYSPLPPPSCDSQCRTSLIQRGIFQQMTCHKNLIKAKCFCCFLCEIVKVDPSCDYQRSFCGGESKSN